MPSDVHHRTAGDYAPGTIPLIQQIQICRIGICTQAMFPWRASALSVAPVIEHQNRRTCGGDFSDLQKAVSGVPRIPVQMQCDEIGSGALTHHA